MLQNKADFHRFTVVEYYRNVFDDTHRLEPPQNPNKTAQKMLFFHGNLYMVGTGIEESLI